MTDAIDAAADEWVKVRGFPFSEAQLARRAFRAGAVAGLRYVTDRMYAGAVDCAAPYWLDDMANNIEAGEEP